MPRINKPRTRRPGNRSSGGRPKLSGPRHLISGRTRTDPNPKIIAARKAAGVIGLGQRVTPLEVARTNGWLTNYECGLAAMYAATYRQAQLGSPGVAAGVSLSIQTSVDRGETNWAALQNWAQLPDKMIAEIWDSAFRDWHDFDTGSFGDNQVQTAMRRWKLMAGVMTSQQRAVVEAIAIRDEWPTWLVARLAGDAPAGEAEHTLLLAGLRAIGDAVRKPKAANDIQANDNEPRRASRSSGPKLRRQYVDSAGRLQFEAFVPVARAGEGDEG